MKLAKLLDLNVLKPEKIVDEYFKDDLNIFKEINSNNLDNTLDTNDNLNNDSENGTNKYDTNENIEKIRNIHGVSPNENIFINGIVVGKSRSEKLALVSKNNEIVDIIGGNIKPHGVGKLGPVDIDKAIVKTGLLRKANPEPRIIANIDNNVNSNVNSDNNDYLNVAFVDHAAEDIYNLKDVDLAVTIGDDTTLVASDILYRFNIPVIGITDGDLDKVVEKGYIADGSTIIELKSGFDDIVGRSIFKNLFNSKYYLKLPIEIDNNHNFENNDYNENIKSKIFEDFKKEVFEIVNNITIEYKIK